MSSSITITNSSHEGWQIVSLKGRLDALTADKVQEALLASLTPETPRTAAETSGLDYMSSAGIRSLLVAAKAAGRLNGGAFAVLKPSPIVRKILAECGLDACLGLTNELPDAV